MISGTAAETARLRFEQRPYLTFAGLALAFAALTAFLASSGIGWFSLLIIEGIGIAGACVLYVSLNNRPIWITCPHCNNDISTQTAWICPECKKENFNVDEFPFSHRCEHCFVPPKAYKCPYRDCAQPIFLSKDKGSANLARAINSVTVEPAASENPLKTPQQRKEEALHEIEMAELEHRLKEARERYEERKPKTHAEKIKASLNEHYTGSFGARDEAQKLKQQITEEFKDRPEEIAWRHKVIDDWLHENI